MIGNLRTNSPLLKITISILAVTSFRVSKLVEQSSPAPKNFRHQRLEGSLKWRSSRSWMSVGGGIGRSQRFRDREGKKLTLSLDVHDSIRTLSWRSKKANCIVMDYTLKCYVPAAGASQATCAGGAKRHSVSLIRPRAESVSSSIGFTQSRRTIIEIGDTGSAKSLHGL